MFNVIFNVISSLINLIIIGLFLLIFTITSHFETLKEEALKYKAPSTSMFREDHDYYIGMFEDNPRKNRCMQNLKCDKNLDDMQGSKYSKSYSWE